MGNLDSVEAKIAGGISSKNRDEIKAELKKLSKEERERIAREANEPTKEELAKLLEEIESGIEGLEYSLDGLEDGLKSKIFKYVLNHGYAKMIETKLKDKLGEGIYSKSKATFEIVYFDKLNQVASPKNIFGFFTEKYGPKASNLFAKVFKKDKDGALDFGALQEGIDEASSLFSEDTNTGAKSRVEEKLGNLKMIADFFNKSVETYDANLDKLIALGKGKAEFEELFNNPLVLSKILETGVYKENGVDINIKANTFVYVIPGDIEGIQRKFLQDVLGRANDNGKALDYLREKQQTVDKVFKGFSKILDGFPSSFKEMITAILSFFGIGGIAGKGMDLIDQIYGKDNKELSLEALEKFGNSDAGKNLLSGTLPNDPKRLKGFFRFTKHIKFGNMTEGVNNPNFWSYILTNKGNDGKVMEVSDEVKALGRIVRGIDKVGDKILSRDLVTKLNSVTKKDIADELKKISDEKAEEQAKNQAPKTPVSPIDTPPVVQNGETPIQQASNDGAPKEGEPRTTSIQTPKGEEVIPQQVSESPYPKLEITGISDDVRFDKEKQHIIIGGLRFKISSLSAGDQEVTGGIIESIVSTEQSTQVKLKFGEEGNIRTLLMADMMLKQGKLAGLKTQVSISSQASKINMLKGLVDSPDDKVQALEKEIVQIDTDLKRGFTEKDIASADIKSFIEKLRDNKRADFDFKDSKGKSTLTLTMGIA